jgi:hypothetical protein
MNRTIKITICLLLTLSLLALPALAGIKATSYIKENYALVHFELTGIEKETALNQSLQSSPVTQLINELVGEKFEICNVQVQDCSIGKIKGTVVIFSIKDTNIQIAYSNTDGVEIATAGKFIEKQKVEVYDVIDGVVYNTAMIDANNNEVKTTLKITPNNDSEVTLVDSSSSTCVSVCDAILSFGCAGFGIWKCIVVCGANPVCSGICGVIWWAVCYMFDPNEGCEGICASFGY